MRLAVAVAAATLAGCGRDVPLKEKPPTPVAVTAVEEMAPQSGERYSASILPQATAAFWSARAGFEPAIGEDR